MSQPTKAYSLAEPSSEELAALLKRPTRVVDVQGLSAEIPISLAACFDRLLNDGIVEGLFRVSGSVRKIKEVKGDYSNLDSWLESSENKPLPRDVSGVVKRYTRDYFHAIGGLFTPSVLAGMHKAYMAHVKEPSERKSSAISTELPSLSEDEAAVPADKSSSLINSVSELIASKNSSSKNALFMYYLHMLSSMAAFHETTKMTSVNFSILFQQHIFETSNLSELPTFQGLLLFLIDNFDSLVARYIADHKTYGEIEEVEVDSASAESADSPVSSPLTECFSNNQSDSRRKSSISNRLSSLWESYNVPARSSKRFSLFSKSSDKLPAEIVVEEPMPTYEEMVSRAQNSSTHEITKSSNLDDFASCLGPTLNPPKISPSLQSILENGPDESPASDAIPTDGYFDPQAEERRASTGNPFLQLFKFRGSLTSVITDGNISPSGPATSPITPPTNSPILAKQANPIEPELPSELSSSSLKPSLGRRLSMRLRKKSVH